MACEEAQYLTPATQPLGSEYNFDKYGDECYKCRKRGHWARDCPCTESSPSNSSPKMSLSLMDVPVVRCPCGKGPCLILPANKSKKNPGREFYSCCQRQVSDKCDFFKWVDEVLEFKAPRCPCGAGACSINKDSNGCWFFACRIKKGHGACRFLQWADSHINTRMNKHFHDGFFPQCLKTSRQVISTSHFMEDEVPKRDLVMQEIESTDHQVVGTLHSEEDEAHFWETVIQETESSNHQVLSTLHSKEDEIPNIESVSKLSNHQFHSTLHCKEDEVPNKSKRLKFTLLSKVEIAIFLLVMCFFYCL